jgi:hypothetical protein
MIIRGRFRKSTILSGTGKLMDEGKKGEKNLLILSH